MKALVSDDDVVAIVRTYADRCHDAARRMGCTPAEATEVAQGAAGDLIDALRTTPESVRDLAGGLFLRTRRLALRVRQTRTLGSNRAAPPPGTRPGVLESAAQSAAVEAGLDELDDGDRWALLVRDSYGLSLHQAAVAMSSEPLETARTVALARLSLVAAIEGGEPISLVGHDLAVGDLGQLSDGSAPPGGRFTAVRRHVAGCALCASVLAAQSQAAEMLSALPVLALSDENRDALLHQTEAHAAAALPTAAVVREQMEQGVHRAALVPPLLIGGLLALGLILGLGIGAVLARGGGPKADSVSAGDAGVPMVATTPPVTVTPTVTVSPSTSPTPPHTPFPITAPRSTIPPASATPTPTPTPSPTVVPAAKLTATPKKGNYNTQVTLVGSGFVPGSTITVTYRDMAGKQIGAAGTAVAGARGGFTTTMTADDGTGVLNNTGPHTFQAGGSGRTASADFNQTS